MLALKTGKACSDFRLVKIPKEEYSPRFAGALSWFDAATDPTTGLVGYENPGGMPPWARKGFEKHFSLEIPTPTAAATLSRLYCGVKKNAPAVKRATAHLVANPPKWSKTSAGEPSRMSYMYWYFGAHTMWQIGGSAWKEQWLPKFTKAALSSQRNDGTNAGSWALSASGARSAAV